MSARNRVVAAGIAVGIILLAVVGIGLGGKSNSRHQVAIVFDTAKGMVPGQVLKIAGTQAGTVDAIELTAKRQARFVVSVDARFLPFRSDAQCQIRPEALISENYVSCNPGSPSKPLLTSRTGGLQTVPVDHTTTPVSLQDLINLFTVPVGDRVRVLIDELGIGTAGRGDDLNALLRRAKPSLVQAHRLLQVIYTQREAIGTIMREGRRALADSARQPAQLEALIGRASDVFETIGSHHQQVEDDLKSLPPLLAAAPPALHSVDRVADNATPLLRALGRSVPSLARLNRTAGPFSAAVRRSLPGLSSVATVGGPTLRAARTPVRLLVRLAADVRPVLASAARVYTSFRNTGVFDAAMRLSVGLGSAAASFDTEGHVLSTNIQFATRCLADAKARGCSRAYDSEGGGNIPINDPTGAPRPDQSPFTGEPLSPTLGGTR